MGTSRYFLLNTFIKNFQVISPCNWSYKTDWDKLSTEWQNKCKQRNVDSRVNCENASVLGWKWYASFTKRNTDSFQTALLNKNINEKWKSVVAAFQGLLEVSEARIFAGNQDMLHTWVRSLTRPFYSIFTQMISAIFVGSWRALWHKTGACQFLKDPFTLLHRRAKGKTWLIINHEFVKEAKTTAARF